jgi:hypothetical protein
MHATHSSTLVRGCRCAGDRWRNETADATHCTFAGLLRALQLCDKFITSNTASTAAFGVLQEEVAKVLTAPQQQVMGSWLCTELGSSACTDARSLFVVSCAAACAVQPCTRPPAPARTRKTYASGAVSTPPKPAAGSKHHSQPPVQQQQQQQQQLQQQPEPGPAHASDSMMRRPQQVPAVIAYDVAAPELPAALLEAKAHLTLNAFDRMVLGAVRGHFHCR